MHPLTCYAGQISLSHAMIEKISENFFVVIDKDGGRGQFLDFMGGTAVMRGDIELMGGPPTRETLLLVVIVYSKLAKYPWKV